MQKWFKNSIARVFMFALVSIFIVGCKPETQKIADNSPKEFSNPARGYSGMSRIFSTKEGLYMSWVEELDSLSTLKYAVYNGTTWSAAQTIASGTDWFVNWADFPTIAVNDGNIFAHYLQKSAPDTYTYDIKYTVFNKASQQWSEARKLHTDTTKSEHGFVSVIPYENGSFMASWLDGRTTVHVADSLRQMTLRAGIINANGSLGKDWQLDNRVCDCCATSISNTNNGVSAVYRDRSSDEIRDIYTVQLKDSVWTSPKAVYNDNWSINGCPVNGPAIASGGGITSVAWFTNANNKSIVQLALSNDNGQTYGNPILLDTKPAIGRVAIRVDNKGNSYVIFMSEAGEDSVLNLVVYNKMGVLKQATNLLSLAAERASGFPQIELYNDNIVVAYTYIEGESSAVKTIIVPFTDK
jgi:hypothetical protein